MMSDSGAGNRVFIFYNLKPDVDREAFERRAREVEGPLADSVDAIRRYVLTRLERTDDPATKPPFEYVEVLDVESVSAYQEGVTGPVVEQFLADWENDTADAVIAFGVAVSPAEELER